MKTIQQEIDNLESSYLKLKEQSKNMGWFAWLFTSRATLMQILALLQAIETLLALLRKEYPKEK